MRDATGELPEGFEFRRLAQPLLEPLALGLRPLLLRNVSDCANELDAADFTSGGMRDDVEMFDTPIGHDLRRTAASFMTKLKVPRLHVEKVLNHSTRDIAEVYDRHDYLAEKRAALERWAEHLQTVIAGKDQSVIAMMVRRG